MTDPAGGDLGPPQAVSVQVVDGKSDVLVLDDSWRWEFKYFRRLLEDAPNFHMTALLARGGGAFAQFAEPERRAGLVGFPHGAGALVPFDVFVLGDVDPRCWPRGLAAGFRDQVSENGKSLVVLAGPNLAHWDAAPGLLDLLPVEINKDTADQIGRAHV